MTTNTETAILDRVIEPGSGELSPDAARYLLSLDFKEDDHRRMHELAQKAQAGTLSEDERQELQNYVDVGHLVALLQSKARVSLRGR